jgi:hypothetical protein
MPRRSNLSARKIMPLAETRLDFVRQEIWVGKV